MDRTQELSGFRLSNTAALSFFAMAEISLDSNQQDVYTQTGRINSQQTGEPSWQL